MDFILSYNNNQEAIHFPFIPNDGVRVKYTQENTVYDGLAGKFQAIGTPGLRTFSIESFFPNKRYNFINPFCESYPPYGWFYIGMIQRGLAMQVPFRAKYYDNTGALVFNMPVTVDSFEYWLNSAGDIGYSIEFTEYRWADLTAEELALQSSEGVATAAGSESINGISTVQTDAQANQEASVGYTPYFTNDDAVVMAKVFFGEARGVLSQTEIACIGWTILNRVDNGAGTIQATITAKNQFYYKSSFRTVSDYGYNLVDLASDVMTRWSKEKCGQTNVGRVLPKEYRWYAGDGQHNYFYPAWPCVRSQRWNYSLPSPYPN